VEAERLLTSPSIAPYPLQTQRSISAPAPDHVEMSEHPGFADVARPGGHPAGCQPEK
jgi:hypothetical protein